MSDSVAWCILAGFKITSVLSRITYHIIESICEFAVSILQEFIYGGKKDVSFKVTKKIHQRKRKPMRPTEDGSLNENGYKNFNCKTKDSMVSRKSQDMNEDILVSGQRFCFRGTDKVIECNLNDARKVTVSFDFYPFQSDSKIEIFSSQKHGLSDPENQIHERDNSSVKPTLPTDPKEANSQINENGIRKDRSRFKYKDDSKVTDETIFKTDCSMYTTKDAVKLSSDVKDATIIDHEALDKTDSDSYSNEQYLKSTVVHLSQDSVSLLDKIAKQQHSLDRFDKQMPDNQPVNKNERLDVSYNPYCNKDISISVTEVKRPTTIINQRQILIEKVLPSDKTETTSHIVEKQISESLPQKQQDKSADIHRTILNPTEQDLVPSASAYNETAPISVKNMQPIQESPANKKTISVSATEKQHVPEYAIDNKKPLAESTSDKNKKPVPACATDKQPLLESSANKKKKFLSESTAVKTPEPASIIDKKRDSEFSAIKKPVSVYPANESKKNIHESTSNKKPVIVYLAEKSKIPVSEYTDKKKPTSVSTTDEKAVPGSTADKPIVSVSAADGKKPAPATDGKKPDSTPATDGKKPNPAPATGGKKPNPESTAPGMKPVFKSTADSKKPAPKSTDENLVPAYTAGRNPVPDSAADNNKVQEVLESRSRDEGTISEVSTCNDVKTPSQMPESAGNIKTEFEGGTDTSYVSDVSTEVESIDTEPISEESKDSGAVKSNSKAVLLVSEDPSDSSQIEDPGDKETMDTGVSDEEFRKTFDKIIEKGPRIVIAPDVLLYPTKQTYTGNRKKNVQNIEMNSKYVDDGWDDTDKCFYEYVIQREKLMGQYDPTDFEVSSREKDSFGENLKNKSEDEACQSKSSLFQGVIIDKYNPMTDIPKYYDLIAEVDKKYVLEKSDVKCYRRRGIIDAFKISKDANNTDNRNVSLKTRHHDTERNLTRSVNTNRGARTFSESSSADSFQRSRQQFKSYEEMGARPRTYSRGTPR